MRSNGGLSRVIRLYDFDLTGADSIQHLIDAGLVQRISCESFREFESRLMADLPRITPDDLTVLDTFTSAVDTTRINSKLGINPAESIWEKRSLYLGGDKNYQTSYNYASEAIMVRMRNIASLHNSKTHIIILAHEDRELDQQSLTYKRGPQANPAAVKMLIRGSTDLMRLTVQQEDVLDKEGNVKRPAGTRLLHLRSTEEQIAKVHVAIALDRTLPSAIANPTMSKVRRILQKNPSILTIYGSAGVGKTTLAVSDAEEQYQAQFTEEKKDEAAA